MKNIKYIFCLSALTVMLGACSDDINLGYSSDNLAVHFSAKVGTSISRASNSESLANGTTVNISNGGDYCSYTADNNGDLTPTGDDFIRWSSSTQTSMSIEAYTPAIDDATVSSFTLANLTDQSTATNLANADFATYDGSVTRTTGSNDVTFELQRHMSQVNIKIASVDSHYTSTSTDKYTFDLTVYSPSTSITVSNGTVTGVGTACEVKPNGGTGIALNGTATAIVTPGANSTTAKFIAVQVKKNGTAIGSPLYVTGRPALSAGYSYTFNLTINDEAVSISSVQVTDWVSVDAITGGEAKSKYTVIDLDKYTSSTEVYNEIKRLNTEESVTAISFIGSIGKMTLSDFFAYSTEKDGIPTCLPIESIDLSGITDLTEISEDTFITNSYLRHVRATQVKSIGDYAFAKCKSLESVVLPNVTSIGLEVFMDCKSLESISLPKVTSIGQWVFSGCNSLESISLPEVTSIGYQAFSGCVLLTSLTDNNFPKLTSIGESAFSGCSSLESINLSAVTSVGRNAFKNFAKLTSISFSSATSIDNYAFSGCTSLTDISLPSATSIGACAFSGCTALTSISLPVATGLGTHAFEDCTLLESVNVPVATSIGDYAFSGCTSLKSISLPVATQIWNYAFSGCTLLTNISLPEAISICPYAFQNCTSLKSISLPKATGIYHYVFSGCTALTSVSIPKAATFCDDIFSGCTTGNIDLTLSSEQKNNVSGKTWSYTYSGTTYSYTFKSISYQ
jgi:hypothetical protein